MNSETKQLASSLGVADIIEMLIKRNTFIKIKDHELNFFSNLKCYLVDLAKFEIGLVIKYILKNINNNI